MIARIPAILVLVLAVFAAAAHPAAAKPTRAESAARSSTDILADMPESARARVGEMSRTLDEAARELRSGLITESRLGTWRERFTIIKRDGQAIANAAQARVESIRSLLEALGPPPEEGGEPAPVANERAKLNRELSQYVALQKQAELILARVDELRAKLLGTQRERFAERLLTRGPTIFRAETWRVAGHDVYEALGRAAQTLVTTPQRTEGAMGWQRALPMNAGVLVVVVLLAWGLRTVLMRRYGRNPETLEPRYITRLVAAVTEGTFRALVPAIAAGALYLSLQYQGLLVGLMATLAESAAIALAFFGLVYGLTKATLAPEQPTWRVIQFTDDCAIRLGRMIITLAAFFAVDAVIFRLGEAMALSVELAVVHNTIVGAVVTVLVLRMMSPEFWRREGAAESGETTTAAQAEATAPPPDDLLEDEEDGATSGEIGRGIGITLAIAIGLTAIAIPLVAALGYFVLARFLTVRLVLSATLVAGLVLLRGLIHEVVIYALRPETAPGRALGHLLGLQAQGLARLRFWLLIPLDLLLLAGGALLGLALWGVSWEVIGTWSSAVLYGLSIGGITISLVEIAIAAGVFFAALAFTRFLQRVLTRQVFRPINMDIGVRQSLNAGISYAGLIVAFLLAIAALGLDLSNLAIIAGALSVGIGFGLQTIVNNFISGLILLIERPVKAGDWVVVGEFEGTVKKINVRATELETLDRAYVILPNSQLISASVTNWTHRNRQCRLIIEVRVPYGCDTQDIHDLLMRCAREHRDILRWPAPYVLFQDFGESGLVFELRCYARDVDYFLTAPSELRFAIDARLRDAGIQIPYPARDIYVRTVPWPDGAEATAPRAEPAEPRRGPQPAPHAGEASRRVPEASDAPEGIE